MQRALRQRSTLLRRLATSQEEERHRIGGELHDGVEPQPTALAVGPRDAEKAPDLASAVARLRPVRELAAQAPAEVRSLARGLWPGLVEEIGLASIRERTLGLAGRVSLRSNPGHGTRLEVRIPVESYDDPTYARTPLAAGAAGSVVKSGADQSLVAAIRAVHQGGWMLELENADLGPLWARRPPRSSGPSRAPLDQLSPASGM